VPSPDFEPVTIVSILLSVSGCEEVKTFLSHPIAVLGKRSDLSTGGKCPNT